ncbi:hypothetical protein NKH77_40270 [Streptomyces sp. M19]
MDEGDSATATLKGSTTAACWIRQPWPRPESRIRRAVPGRLPERPRLLVDAGQDHRQPHRQRGRSDQRPGQGEKRDFSGFEGASRYNEITSECFVDVNVGRDQFRVDIADPSGENKALTGKKCDVGIQLARQVVAKIKK